MTIRATLITYVEADCTHPECGISRLTGGVQWISPRSTDRGDAEQALAVHERLWHLGQDECSAPDCTHLAAEPRTTYAVPGDPRVCPDHSRLRWKAERIVPRIFCEDAQCLGRDAEVFAWDGGRSAMLCSTCAAQYHDGRIALQRMRLGAVDSRV